MWEDEALDNSVWRAGCQVCRTPDLEAYEGISWERRYLLYCLSNVAGRLLNLGWTNMIHVIQSMVPCIQCLSPLRANTGWKISRPSWSPAMMISTLTLIQFESISSYECLWVYNAAGEDDSRWSCHAAPCSSLTRLRVQRQNERWLITELTSLPLPCFLLWQLWLLGFFLAHASNQTIQLWYSSLAPVSKDPVFQSAASPRGERLSYEPVDVCMVVHDHLESGWTAAWPYYIWYRYCVRHPAAPPPPTHTHIHPHLCLNPCVSLFQIE